MIIQQKNTYLGGLTNAWDFFQTLYDEKILTSFTQELHECYVMLMLSWQYVFIMMVPRAHRLLLFWRNSGSSVVCLVPFNNHTRASVSEEKHKTLDPLGHVSLHVTPKDTHIENN